MQLYKTSFADGLVLSYQKEDTVIGGQIAASGVYEPFEEELLLSVLKKGETAIDIGANIGVYTLQMAKKVGKTGSIFAFEPEPDNAAILAKNAADNGFENISIFPFALSNTSKKTRLYLSPDNMGDHRVYNGEYKRQRSSIPIEAKRLDDVIKATEHIAVIKIDTQGYEPFVIEGARQTILKNKPKIFLEYWPFGYKKAHANTNDMIHFLEFVYDSVFVINGRERELAPFTHAMFSEEKDAWSNLLFI